MMKKKYQRPMLEQMQLRGKPLLAPESGGGTEESGARPYNMTNPEE